MKRQDTQKRLPTAQDYTRVEGILGRARQHAKSRTEENAKVEQYARAMANVIQDGNKASRRANAAYELGEKGVCAIFERRATVLHEAAFDALYASNAASMA